MDPDKPKTGLVIKLSSETVQKLQEAPPPPKESRSDPTPSESFIPDEGKENKHAVEEQEPKSKAKSVSETEHHEHDKPCVETDTPRATDANTESSWGEYAPYVAYEGDTAIYTDPTSKTQYTWDVTSNSWQARTSDPSTQTDSRLYTYEDDTHVYTEVDGSKFFWDEEKKAWLPKVDDDFLARYQMSYGFVDNISKEPEKKQPENKLEKNEQPKTSGLKRKAAEPPKWFDASDDQNNTKVYVSNLPDDLTEEEFVNVMQKCGLIMQDPTSKKMKIKLYTDKETGNFKGDALCTYIKIESVDLALKLLDGSDLHGRTISVQRAKFQMKGDYNPSLKPKKKKKKELEKIKRMQEKLFDWRPEKKAVGERAKNEKVVIIKNLFDPAIFDKEVQLILDYQQDLREECGKCGEVRKVVLYDRHPEGVVQITMKEPEEADAVVALLNGRWFCKRQLTAEIWDGRTKYRIAETDADMNKRVGKWEKFLEGGDATESKEKENGDNTALASTAAETVASEQSIETVAKEE